MVSFSGPVPILRSFDDQRAREFWCDWLRFTVDWEHRFEPGFPLYMQIRRDACVLHLSEHHGDATPGAAVRIQVPDVAALLTELRSRPYAFAQPEIVEQGWGAHEIILRDPFANRVVFWSAVATGPLPK